MRSAQALPSRKILFARVLFWRVYPKWPLTLYANKRVFVIIVVSCVPNILSVQASLFEIFVFKLFSLTPVNSKCLSTSTKNNIWSLGTFCYTHILNMSSGKTFLLEISCLKQDLQTLICRTAHMHVHIHTYIHKHAFKTWEVTITTKTKSRIT